MRHWYVYHSAETMGYRYGNPQPLRVFSAKKRPRLSIGDRIWLIEGVGQSPKRYFLSATFLCREVLQAPFPATFGTVSPKFRYIFCGDGQAFGDAIPLARHDWFADLHRRYLTKQRFFDEITDERAICDGLAITLKAHDQESRKERSAVA
jgi:hypothetical protein